MLFVTVGMKTCQARLLEKKLQEDMASMPRHATKILNLLLLTMSNEDDLDNWTNTRDV